MITISADDTFQQYLDTHEQVIVKYYAKWCGVCRLFSPKFKKISDKDEFSHILFLDINAEESPVARKLAGVNSLPFFAVFKNGQLVAGEATTKENVVENLIKKLS
jgi:thiol-disulfide isomerase/thioredoxin